MLLAHLWFMLNHNILTNILIKLPLDSQAIESFQCSLWKYNAYSTNYLLNDIHKINDASGLELLYFKIDSKIWHNLIDFYLWFWT